MAAGAGWTTGKRNREEAEGAVSEEETGWSREAAVGKSDPESLAAGRTAGPEKAGGPQGPMAWRQE